MLRVATFPDHGHSRFRDRHSEYARSLQVGPAGRTPARQTDPQVSAGCVP
jgi:hypothetical protein